MATSPCLYQGQASQPNDYRSQRGGGGGGMEELKQEDFIGTLMSLL